MKILIVSPFFPPQNSIASLRVYSFAKYWSQSSHSVDVLTTEKNTSKQDLSYECVRFNRIDAKLPGFIQRLKSSYRHGDENGVITKRSIFKDYFEKLRKKTGVFSSCRMPDFSDFWILNAIKKAKKYGPWDVVVSSYGPYSAHLVGWQIKKRGLADFWVADFRDTWSNNHIYKGLFPFSFLEAKLEKKIMEKADLITAVSEPFVQMLKKIHKDKKILVIENGFDPDDLLTMPKAFQFPKDGKIRLIHTGSIYPGKSDPTPLFKVIKELSLDTTYSSQIDRIEVLFSGLNLGKLDQLIKKYQVGRWVKNIGFKSRSVTLSMQRDASVLILLSWKDETVDGVMTGKIYEYLYSKTPIVSIGRNKPSTVEKLLLESKKGLHLSNSFEIKRYITDLLEKGSPDKISLNDNLYTHYHRKTLADKMMGLIEDLKCENIHETENSSYHCHT